MGQLLFGTGRTLITPPLGLELCGYGPYLGRQGTEVYQDLFSTSLALSAGGETYVLVSNDLIWLDRTLLEAIHAQLYKQHGLMPRQVLLTNTHTHSGPVTMKTVAWGEPDEAYWRTLVSCIVESVGQAIAALKPGRIGFGRVDLPELSVNRVEPDGPIDTEALLFRIDDEQGVLRAAGINFSAHPVTMGVSSLICGDYPGNGVAKMEQALDDTARILFFQGSCGNLNCRGFGDGVERMEANGTLLKETILPALQAIRTDSEVSLTADRVDMSLPMQVPERADVVREIGEYEGQLAAFEGDQASREYRQLRFERDWRRARIELIDGPHPTRLEFHLSYLRINDTVLIGHPFELFLEHGIAIQKASPYPYTFLIGYANEAIGYLARPQDFTLQGFGHYAAVYAPHICRHLEFQPEAGQVFRNHVAALLYRVKQKQ